MRQRRQRDEERGNSRPHPQTSVMAKRACWCGNADFFPFGPEYGECRACGTLVYLKDMPPEQLLVRDDETDFYGKKYWLEHQQSAFGHDDIHTRARNDLTERNLHWLKALLKYRLPPAEVLEIGCAHGSFVALMRQAGYEAFGAEMSPWVVAFGQETFGVPVRAGPIESLDVSAASLDVIALMDVLEHLPDPTATMRHCFELLKPDGLLLIQTPQFKEGMCHNELVKSKHIFLDQLKSDEHLYLFSQRSVTEFFQRLGAEHIYFEPAIFAHYDMFFAVSCAPIKPHAPEEMESALLATPSGRLALALLDLRERELELTRKWAASESDRAARGEQIESLSVMLKAAEADRTGRAEQIESLSVMLKEAETDRTARGEQIESLSVMLKESEADRAERAEQIESLSVMLKESDADRTGRAEQIESLSLMLKESEADRGERAVQIESLTVMLKESETDRMARGEQIETLSVMLRESDSDRMARGEQIRALTIDLRALFSRPAFRWLVRVLGWREVKKLAERVGMPGLK